MSSIVYTSTRSCYTMDPIRSVFTVTTACARLKVYHMVDFEGTFGCQRAGFRQQVDSAQRKTAWCHVLVSLTEVFGWMWPETRNMGLGTKNRQKQTCWTFAASISAKRTRTTWGEWRNSLWSSRELAAMLVPQARNDKPPLSCCTSLDDGRLAAIFSSQKQARTALQVFSGHDFLCALLSFFLLSIFWIRITHNCYYPVIG